MRRLDIGIASYRNPEALRACLAALMERSRTDLRVFVLHNPSEDDEATREVIRWNEANDKRIVAVWLPENVGYAGAVAKLMETAETEYIAYLDNDARVITNGWDEALCGYLDRFHEIGMVFPNGGAYEIDRGNYHEIMWGVGFCWVLNRMAMKAAGLFDTSLGHQEEADYSMRIRMAGYKCAAAREVQVQHLATATNDPKAIERINAGVIAFVNKWNRYFCGSHFNYFSPNVLRWEDWPPQALYLEEWWNIHFPGLNANPDVIHSMGREYDLIRVPRYKDFYRNRTI